MRFFQEPRIREERGEYYLTEHGWILKNSYHSRWGHGYADKGFIKGWPSYLATLTMPTIIFVFLVVSLLSTETIIGFISGIVITVPLVVIMYINLVRDIFFIDYHRTFEDAEKEWEKIKSFGQP